jgi:protein gp37
MAWRKNVGEFTRISWTDHTFNPWWICTEVSPGCDNCYAREFAKRYGFEWGKGVPRREFGDKHWNEPLKWNRAAAKEGRRHRVFCASMADVMDDEAPVGVRERLWDLIDATPWLVWQLLTKRPQRYERYLPKTFKHGNVWLGTTTENQENYNLRWPILLKECSDRDLYSWISYEPALGPISLTEFPTFPSWVVFGGESGNRRRECKAEWAESILKEIREYAPSVSFFMKQMSARTPDIGKKLIPEHLKIQQFPDKHVCTN